MSQCSDSPLIIACMSRSGSSLTTSILQSAGLNVGERFLPPFLGAENGLFENLDFVHFHKDLLTSLGQPVQGWVSQDLPALDDSVSLVARELIARNRKNTAWGWKDPRNTLFLEMWKEIVPSARYLFLIRKPWEVIDSLYRRGDEAFIGNPSFALDVWTHYNSRIAAFVRRYPERSLLVNIEAILASPCSLVDVLNSRFKYDLKSPAENLIDNNLFRTEASSLELIVQTEFPEAYSVWENVKMLAESCFAASSRERPRSSPRLLLNDWQCMRYVEASRKNRLEEEVSQCRVALSKADAEMMQLRKDFETEMQRRLLESNTAKLRAETMAMEEQISIAKSFLSKRDNSPIERLKVARQIVANAGSQNLPWMKTAAMLRSARRSLHSSGLFDQAFYLSRYADVGEASIDPILHYLTWGAAEGRFPNPLFDTYFYASQLNEDSDINPLLHYIETGGRFGLKPHPLFDSLYYLESNPDVAQAGLNPLAHYLLYGDREFRKPNATFDPAFYRLELSTSMSFSLPTLCHYALIGFKYDLPTEGPKFPSACLAQLQLQHLRR